MYTNNFFFLSLSFSLPIEFSSNSEFYCKSVYASLTFIERETAPFYQVLSRNEFNLIPSNLVAREFVLIQFERREPTYSIRPVKASPSFVNKPRRDFRLRFRARARR